MDGIVAKLAGIPVVTSSEKEMKQRASLMHDDVFYIFRDKKPVFLETEVDGLFA